MERRKKRYINRSNHIALNQQKTETIVEETTTFVDKTAIIVEETTTFVAKTVNVEETTTIVEETGNVISRHIFSCLGV